MIDDDLLNRFEAAYGDEEQLIEIVTILGSQGLDQIDIYIHFEDFLHYLERNGRDDDPDADAVYNVIERVYGWCPQTRKLFGNTLSNEEVRERRALKAK